TATGGEEKALLAPNPPPSQDTLPTMERSDCSTEYTSRHLTDFELVQRLARCGLGVVCQVRNKLDENEYAVKRINLPTNKSSAERVKREVRAPANLNHTNIVRYYNSWLETPPPGWQHPQDTMHSEQVSCVCHAPVCWLLLAARPVCWLLLAARPCLLAPAGSTPCLLAPAGSTPLSAGSCWQHALSAGSCWQHALSAGSCWQHALSVHLPGRNPDCCTLNRLLRYQDWHRLPGYLWHALIQLMCEHHCRELCRGRCGIHVMVQVQIPYKLSCAGWASARHVPEVFIAHIARLHINNKRARRDLRLSTPINT
ncbi:hypothetical protein O3P69_019902, partial [Scylla paramamosain]